ncbi:MAG TPA: tripartite tricarboxylate transporter substrate-binding protein [Xanthobacteraceae bacterium]
MSADRTTASFLAGWAALVALDISQAYADDFYKGKTIKLYIGSGPGGGYDLFGRLVARHIGEHLAGNPAVTPQNMPGAGSIVVTNYMYNLAPKDGLSLAIASPSLALIDALQTPGVRFKTEKLTWIGRVSPNINVTVTPHGSPVKTIDDARKRETLISAIAATSPLTLLPQVMNATTGTRFKLVRGYADSAAALLAMERGEADGTTVSWATLKATRSQWIKTGEVNILVQYALQRARELKGVPAATEAAISPDDKRLLSLFVSGADVGYAIFTTPGVPADRVEALRAAFTEMTLDPAFKGDSEQFGIDLEPMTGSDLQSMIENTTVFPESVRRRAKEVAKME